MDVRDVLQGARALVEAGWHQGRLTDGRGNYCAKAAISIAAGVSEDTQGSVVFLPYIDKLPWRERVEYMNRVRVEMAAFAAFAGQMPEPFDSIPLFNDDPATTQQDVLAVFDKAVASC